MFGIRALAAALMIALCNDAAARSTKHLIFFDAGATVITPSAAQTLRLFADLLKRADERCPMQGRREAVGGLSRDRQTLLKFVMDVIRVDPMDVSLTRKLYTEQKTRLKALIREGETSGPPVAWDSSWIKAEAKRRVGSSVPTSEPGDCE